MGHLSTTPLMSFLSITSILMNLLFNDKWHNPCHNYNSLLKVYFAKHKLRGHEMDRTIMNIWFNFDLSIITVYEKRPLLT